LGRLGIPPDIWWFHRGRVGVLSEEEKSGLGKKALGALKGTHGGCVFYCPLRGGKIPPGYIREGLKKRPGGNTREKGGCPLSAKRGKGGPPENRPMG